MLKPLFLARPLARQFSVLAADPIPAPARGAAWVPAAAGLLWLVVVTGVVAARQEIAPAANITPENAVKSFAISSAQPILNDYAFGGYLDFVGIPPFTDGRGEPYGAAFTLRHDRAVALRDLPDFLRMLDEYRIGTTLLAPTTPAVALLDRLPDWQRAYADEVAVAHTRRASP